MICESLLFLSFNIRVFLTFFFQHFLNEIKPSNEVSNDDEQKDGEAGIRTMTHVTNSFSL